MGGCQNRLVLGRWVIRWLGRVLRPAPIRLGAVPKDCAKRHARPCRTTRRMLPIRGGTILATFLARPGSLSRNETRRHRTIHASCRNRPVYRTRRQPCRIAGGGGSRRPPRRIGQCFSRHSSGSCRPTLSASRRSPLRAPRCRIRDASDRDRRSRAANAILAPRCASRRHHPLPRHGRCSRNKHSRQILADRIAVHGHHAPTD
jgi:hypothetical protein